MSCLHQCPGIFGFGHQPSLFRIRGFVLSLPSHPSSQSIEGRRRLAPSSIVSRLCRRHTKKQIDEKKKKMNNNHHNHNCTKHLKACLQSSSSLCLIQQNRPSKQTKPKHYLESLLQPRSDRHYSVLHTTLCPQRDTVLPLSQAHHQTTHLWLIISLHS